METTAARQLIGFLHDLSAERLPPAIAARAKDCLLDALGCGLFGSLQPWSRILAEEAASDGSTGTATVIGGRETLAAPLAALCNGTAVHGFELDDLIAASIIHPAAAVVPAALAAAESCGASGARVLLGIVAGYEMMHRAGLAMGDEPVRKGFHVTSLTAPLAAATAAGVVMGLTEHQLASAIGLSCSMAGGVKNFATGHGGGMVKRLHLGRGAEAGVRCAQLAQRGFEGPPNAIDGRMGLMEVFGGAGADPAPLTRGLGEDWAIGDIWFKVYPICGWIQSTVQLLTELRDGPPIDPARVDAIKVGVSSYAARNNGEPAPVDTMGAQYSIPYCSALALLGDPRDPDGYAADKVADPALRALAARVEVWVDPAVEAVYPKSFAASVSLALDGGPAREKTVMECHGTPSDPCSAEELRQKFLLLAGKRLAAATAEELAEQVARLETLPDFARVGALLRQIER